MDNEIDNPDPQRGEQIRALTDEYAFLSNDFPAPLVFEGHDGGAERQYASVTHAYHALTMASPEDFAAIADAPTAADARERARTTALREDWDEERKLRLMRDLVFTKFSSDPQLMAQLISLQGCHIEHGNDWGDTYWGIVGGQGENHLGRILMHTRNLLTVGENMKKLIADTSALIGNLREKHRGDGE